MCKIFKVNSPTEIQGNPPDRAVWRNKASSAVFFSSTVRVVVVFCWLCRQFIKYLLLSRRVDGGTMVECGGLGSVLSPLLLRHWPPSVLLLHWLEDSLLTVIWVVSNLLHSPCNPSAGQCVLVVLATCCIATTASYRTVHSDNVLHETYSWGTWCEASGAHPVRERLPYEPCHVQTHFAVHVVLRSKSK